MTSTPLLPEKDPQDAISEDGFFIAEDALLGQRIKEMDDDAVPFASERGLLFCKDNVLDHPVSMRGRLHTGHANLYSVSDPS